jgi:hypothetical protein
MINPKIMEAFYKDWTDETHPEDPIAVANVLQHLIDEHSEVRGTGRVDKKSQVVSVKTLMKLIEELK